MYELHGKEFNLIEEGSLGVIAYDNSNPLLYKDSTLAWELFTILEKTDTYMRLSMNAPVEVNSYLGAIVSQDRSIVYWVNDTKPLP